MVHDLCVSLEMAISAFGVWLVTDGCCIVCLESGSVEYNTLTPPAYAPDDNYNNIIVS